MAFVRQSSPKSSFHDDHGVGIASDDGVDISEDVNTRPPGRTTGPATGRQSAALRRGTELSRVRGAWTRQRLTQLRVEEGKSLRECAEIMGMHYSRIRTVWREVVAKASEDEGLDSDKKEQLRVHLELQLRQIIQEGMAKFDKGAAYGSAALAAIKQLADLYGLKRDIGSEPAEKVTMAELGQEVRAISPLLFKRLQEADLVSSRSKGGTR